MANESDELRDTIPSPHPDVAVDVHTVESDRQKLGRVLDAVNRAIDDATGCSGLSSEESWSAYLHAMRVMRVARAALEQEIERIGMGSV